MDGSQSVSCFHGKSSAGCSARRSSTLTDSRTRLGVPFKKGYFLPPCYFLVNTKWSLITRLHCQAKKLIRQARARDWHPSCTHLLSAPIACKVSRASVDKHSFRCSVLSDRRPCFTQSAQMEHHPPTDGPTVTSDSAQCTQPKHKPLSCPDKYTRVES